MNKVYSDHPVSVRVRIHRRKKSLLHELQAIIYKRGDTSSLDCLEELVATLQKEGEEQNAEEC